MTTLDLYQHYAAQCPLGARGDVVPGIPLPAALQITTWQHATDLPRAVSLHLTRLQQGKRLQQISITWLTDLASRLANE